MALQTTSLKELSICVRGETSQSDTNLITEVKKVILKIYHALTQYILPLDLIPKESFVQWMEILRQVVEQEIPAEALTDDIDDEDKPSLI